MICNKMGTYAVHSKKIDYNTQNAAAAIINTHTSYRTLFL